nr:MAG TPA: hypothetical protein [Caudoviricetes sp.]
MHSDSSSSHAGRKPANFSPFIEWSEVGLLKTDKASERRNSQIMLPVE